MNFNPDNLTKREQLIYHSAHEEGFQKGLAFGLKAAHQISNGRTIDPDAPQTKRIVATGRLTESGIKFDAVCDWPGMVDGLTCDETLAAYLGVVRQ